MSSADDPTDVAPDAPTTSEPELRGDLDGDGHLDAHERFHLLRDAAIEAEYATGRHEETEAEAKRNVVLRLATITLGFIVLLGGLAMMVLPGPGIIGIIAGLGILSRELAWAERLLEIAKEKARVEELKQQPKWVQAATWTATIAAVCASLWFVFLADPKPDVMGVLPWNWD